MPHISPASRGSCTKWSMLWPIKGWNVRHAAPTSSHVRPATTQCHLQGITEPSIWVQATQFRFAVKFQKDICQVLCSSMCDTLCKIFNKLIFISVNNWRITKNFGLGSVHPAQSNGRCRTQRCTAKNWIWSASDAEAGKRVLAKGHRVLRCQGAA